MKRIIYILSFFLVAVAANAQPVCCPKFSLQQVGETITCPGDSSCKGGAGTAAGGNPVIQAPAMVACKNSTQTYVVVPNMAGFTYSWTVTGGILQSTTANQGVIVWGSGSQGFIKVVISNANGSCKDSVFAKVCLINSPVAAFTVLPGSTVCMSNPTVQFTNTSTGATTWNWNFGDGATSNTANPVHTYGATGTYTVVLTVTNTPPAGPNGEISRCGCTDTATMVINVIAGTGPSIISTCKKMLCAGDTVTYCASGCTGPYTWTVVGGTPTSGTGNCIQVTWNPSPGQQPSITLTAASGCGPCGNSTTMSVPVLFNNMPITPTNTACQNSTVTYSMAALPGTFYNWTVSGGTLVGPITNTNTVTINWGMGPVGTIACNYQNPYTKCSGSTSQTIQIRPVFKMTGPATVCTGNGTFFSTNGPGNWTIGAPAAAYTFGGSTTGVSSINITTWNIAGSYNISAIPTTLSNYCNASANINLIVKPTPVLTPVTGPNPVCLNGFYVYVVSSNLPGPFVWNVTGGVVVSQMGANNDSAVVQWTAAGGTINVSQTVNGCTGTASFGPVNIIPTPSISGPTNVCRDQTPHPAYTATGALPAGSYIWSITPAAAGTIMSGQGTNSITVLWSGAATPGTNPATVSVTVCGNTVNYPVTVTTPPNGTVTATGNLCVTGVTLSVSPAMPCYQWYLNGVLIPGATSATYLATTHGYYEVKCPTGCSGYAGKFVPRVTNPNASISTGGITSYCTGATISLTLAALSSPGCSYQWYQNGVLMPGQTNNTLAVNAAGSYYMVLTCGNCKDTSNTIPVTIQNCDPGCVNYVYMPSAIEEELNRTGGPAKDATAAEKAAFVPSLTINFPTTNCNNALFSGTYSVVSPWTFSSGIHWNFGDGSPLGLSANAATISHNYTAPGYYLVTAWINVICPPDGRICQFIDTATVYVPLAAVFTPQVNCGTILLNNTSQAVAGCTFTNAWTVTSGPAGWAFSSTTAYNPTLTVTQSGNYTIQYTMSSPGCNCVMIYSQTVTVNLPSASFTLPSPICAGTAVPFNAPAGQSHYLWNFGDGYTSAMASTTHTFGNTPTNPTVSLTVVNALGCSTTVQQLINILPTPVITITPDQFICPGSTGTITATTGFSNYAWYHNGTLVQNGASNTYTTGNMGTYWVVASNGSGCSVKSAQTHIFYHPKPIASIQGTSTACLYGGTGSIYLSNIINDPNSTYSWWLSGGTASPTTNYDLNVTISTPGTYTFVLTVTTNKGCVAKDTFCVVASAAPVVTVTPSATGTLCAGANYSFTASAAPTGPAYIYQWSNGVSGPSMSTSSPGMYFVTATNPATGCSSTQFAGIINPRPNTILFPVGCDTLCDTAKIIPPLPLGVGQNYGLYNIVWLDNGSPISPQPTPQHILQLASLAPGLHNISIIVTLPNGCKDTSGVYNIFVKHCGDCNCKGSDWVDLYWQYSDIAVPAEPVDPVKQTKPGAKNTKAIIPTGAKPFKCGDYLGVFDCKKPITINAAYKCNPDSCSQVVKYVLTGTDINGPVNLSGNMAFSTAGLLQGNYMLTMYGKCGDSVCKECVVKFDIKCEEIDCCKGSKWGDKTIAIGGAVKKLNCPGEYKVKCNQPITINASYICATTGCDGQVKYNLLPPTGGAITGGMPLTFTPNQAGTYVLTLYGICGGIVCDSCVVKFTTDCTPPPPPPCCPYEFSVKDPAVTTSTLASPAATIANANFGISGIMIPSGLPITGNLFTEIRAEVVSYALYDNYGGECMNCKSYPYTWASMYQPGNVSGIPPAITMFNSTSPSFNPSGNGMYQNPREVVWSSASPFALPNNINLSFLLPPASIIDCCELTAKICVKFTFRDKECKECEVIVCFPVVIKPGGGTPPPKDCVCKIEPVFSYEGGSKAVSCGKSTTLFQGNIPVSMQPNFTCKDANGKDCPSTAPSVTISKNGGPATVLTGPAYNYTFTQPGSYEYTIVGVCAGKKCECKVTVKIP